LPLFLGKDEMDARPPWPMPLGVLLSVGMNLDCCLDFDLSGLSLLDICSGLSRILPYFERTENLSSGAYEKLLSLRFKSGSSEG
jgi:hypothetical protein